MGDKCAVVTGSTGQDGWYLIQHLHSKGYRVHAQSRSNPLGQTLAGRVHWHIGELTDERFLEKLIVNIAPDEFYNLAAITRPAQSWIEPSETLAVNAGVPQKLCELIASRLPSCHLFQASTSDIFGSPTNFPQGEEGSLHPLSPYAASKAYSDQIIRAYRRKYGLHLSIGVLFNHESPRRQMAFVSQKIAYAAAAIGLGLTQTLALDELGNPIVRDGRVTLGNLAVRRDFGFAGDYVEAMSVIAAHETPGDYVIGTGENHSIAEFCETAFAAVGKDWNKHVYVDPLLTRKDDYDTLADVSKIRAQLGWRAKTSFSDMVTMMVQHQINALQKSLAR